MKHSKIRIIPRTDFTNEYLKISYNNTINSVYQLFKTSENNLIPKQPREFVCEGGWGWHDILCSDPVSNILDDLGNIKFVVKISLE